MSDGDEYVRVTGTIEAIREGSFLFGVGESVKRAAWIPRSLIHGADDKMLAAKKRGDEMTVRIFRWKAEDVGFITDRDDRTQDLF